MDQATRDVARETAAAVEKSGRAGVRLEVYRGHDADRTRVFVSRQNRGITPTIRRELRRRAAIEPVIGHMKTDGHLGRNFLRGAEGDAINAILAGVGHNLRFLRRWLFALICTLLTLAQRRGPVSTPGPQRSPDRLIHGRLDRVE